MLKTPKRLIIKAALVVVVKKVKEKVFIGNNVFYHKIVQNVWSVNGINWVGSDFYGELEILRDFIKWFFVVVDIDAAQSHVFSIEDTCYDY